MTDEFEDLEEPPEEGLTPFKKVVLAALVLLLVISVAARALTGGGDSPSGAPSAQPNPATGLASGLTSGDTSRTPAAEPEPEGLERWLPYLTEGSLFGLIGFALGYATRKVFKLALILIALLFVALQGLTYMGAVQVEWGKTVEWINGLILNLKENEPLTEFLTHRVPSAGALIAGWFLGLRRG